MNYSKVYFYCDSNRAKRDLQIIYYKYIVSFKVFDIIGVKHRQSFKIMYKKTRI